MRNDEMQWSTQSPIAFSDVRIGLDAREEKWPLTKSITSMPAFQDDRMIGAVHRGLAHHGQRQAR